MFDVKKYLIKIEGNRQYLPVSARLVWFRQEHPDWGIATNPVTIDLQAQTAVFEATVFNAEGRLMAKGTKMETAQGFPAFVEAAETGAIGRALAVCGYGTQFAPDLDLDEITNGRVVDSPQPSVSAPSSGAQQSGRSADRSRPQSEAVDGRNADGSTQLQSANSNGSGRDGGSSTAGTSVSPSDQHTEQECAGCGRSITKGQEALSVRKFGIALCPDCQKERKAADTGA